MCHMIPRTELGTQQIVCKHFLSLMYLGQEQSVVSGSGAEIKSIAANPPVSNMFTHIRPRFFFCLVVHLFVLFELRLGMCLLNGGKSLGKKEERIPQNLLL